MFKKLQLIISILFLFLCNINAQDNILIQDNSNKIATIHNDLEIFTNYEIQKMDSLLSVWYVQNELTNKNSVLSTLKDDTTKYENNDSLLFKRLSQIITAVPLAYNDRVKRFIELYSIQRQRSSSIILTLAQYYYPWMKAIFDKYDVPEELVYVTIIES